VSHDTAQPLRLEDVPPHLRVTDPTPAPVYVQGGPTTGQPLTLRIVHAGSLVTAVVLDGQPSAPAHGARLYRLPQEAYLGGPFVTVLAPHPDCQATCCRPSATLFVTSEKECLHQ
jgi:hypothetical protein